MSRVLKECIDRGYNVYLDFEGNEVTLSWNKHYIGDTGNHIHVPIDDFFANPDEYYRDILRQDDKDEK